MYLYASSPLRNAMYGLMCICLLVACNKSPEKSSSQTATQSQTQLTDQATKHKKTKTDTKRKAEPVTTNDTEPKPKPNPSSNVLYEKYISHPNHTDVDIEIQKRAVFVQQRHSLALQSDRSVDPKLKRGGAKSLYITPLVQDIERVLSTDQNNRSVRVMSLLVDPATPNRLVHEVLYSAMMSAPKNTEERTVAFGTPPGIRGGRFFITTSRGEAEASLFAIPKSNIGPTAGDSPIARSLFLHVTLQGIEITDNESKREQRTKIPPIRGCPKEGPTICPPKDQDPSRAYSDVQKASTDQERREALQRLVQHYDWRSLYNALVDLKSSMKDTDNIHIYVAPELPFELLNELAATVQVVRSGTDAKGHFEHTKAFDAARPKRDMQNPCALEKGTLFPCMFLDFND